MAALVIFLLADVVLLSSGEARISRKSITKLALVGMLALMLTVDVLVALIVFAAAGSTAGVVYCVAAAIAAVVTFVVASRS